MNCQVVCNEKLKIMNIVTGYPGATHDARVWGNCSLNWDLEDNNVEGMLLGDSAYTLRRFLMIPVSQKRRTSDMAEVSAQYLRSKIKLTEEKIDYYENKKKQKTQRHELKVSILKNQYKSQLKE